MSPGSPDASDELQVIPRRPSGPPPAAGGPGGSAPSQPPGTPADPVRQKRLTRIVAGVVGGCALLLIVAGIARAVRPHDAIATPAASASATAAPPAPTAPPAATPTQNAAPALPPPPTTGTLLLDRPASPGKVWLDGKKVTAKSLETTCGKHQLKVGPYGKAKSVNIPCGGELHVSH